MRIVGRLPGFALVSVLALLAGCAAGPHRAGTPPAPGCDAWDDAERCAIPFARLLADPAAIEGKVVGLTGYLVSDAGRLTLYPSAASFEGWIQEEGVLLRPPFDISESLWNELQRGPGVYPVLVWARFTRNADNNPRLRLRAGTLYDIRRIVQPSRVMPVFPPDPRGISIRKE